MLCAVYRSPKRVDTYLYMVHPADFSVLPESLAKSFGQPQHVMTLALTEERKLARLSVAELKEHLQDAGYYLQIPPPPQSLLKKELAK
ncbi:YcgL domain-containing protein [Pseudidiomarina sp. E22-M8]|uniref:YcgL domain-containing protein n=1 Tax=Pseudidiomarina sp. E22-M8 TaxID=3424768 RepID=UPI00403C12A6